MGFDDAETPMLANGTRVQLWKWASEGVVKGSKRGRDNEWAYTVLCDDGTERNVHITHIHSVELHPRKYVVRTQLEGALPSLETRKREQE